MPTNEKLIESIKEIDENFDHEGQSNADMVAVLKWLRLKQSILALDENADIEDKDVDELTAMLEELKPEPGDPASEAVEAKAAAKKLKEENAAKKKAAKKPPYTVANGKSITTKRGIIAEGDEIKAADLAGGTKAITDFVESGHIDKN